MAADRPLRTFWSVVTALVLCCAVGLFWPGLGRWGAAVAGLSEDKVQDNCIHPASISRRLTIGPTNTTSAGVVTATFKTVWFDAFSNRERTDKESGNTTLLHHDVGLGFEYNSGGCTPFLFPPRNLTAFCFAGTAAVLGDERLAGKMTTVVLDGPTNSTTTTTTVGTKISSSNVTRLHTVLPALRTGYVVPVQVLETAGEIFIRFEQFIDYQPFNKPLADQSVFDVPAICTH